MPRDVLLEIPDRLEALAGLLSDALVARHGNDAVRALVAARVVPGDLPAYLAKLNAPADVALDQYLTRALFHEGLTLVALACLRAGGEIRWDAFDDLLPLLKRFVSFYATSSPRYASFRTLSRDRLAEFWNSYCADAEWFGLLAEATRFQALRLCAHHDASHGKAEAVPALLNGVLGPIWARASQRAGLQEADATLVWEEMESRCGR